MFALILGLLLIVLGIILLFGGSFIWGVIALLGGVVLALTRSF